jgi:hypothetical protein
MIWSIFAFGIGMENTENVDDVDQAQKELDEMNRDDGAAQSVPEVPEVPEKKRTKGRNPHHDTSPLTEGPVRTNVKIRKKKKKKEPMSPKRQAELKRSFFIFCTMVVLSVAIALSMWQCSKWLEFETEIHESHAQYLDDAKLQDGIYLAASRIEIDEDFTMFEDLKVNYSEVTTFKQLNKAPVKVYFKFRRDGRRLDIIVVASASGEILSARETYDRKTIKNIKQLLRPDAPPKPKNKVKVVIESDRFKRKPVK